MDPLLQRLEIAQETLTALVGVLNMPIRPDHAFVQAILDGANTKLRAIEAGPATAPFVAPNLVPAVPAKP